MSYQVLARKWRPRDFTQVVGQTHVLRALVNALDSQRLHHAYLFSGTRGVGKTSLARVFAKALNCERGVSSQPCGVCSACVEVDEGRFVDLIEVDAASRTRVDETRDLLDNVQYAPTRGRYKVYLIDEVHMFSNHSFNALLKTLEEPPPHVKFLLATTDPKRLPVTILSRCLQFNLKRLSAEQLLLQLKSIAEKEQLPLIEEGLALIAEAADGSVRDALSLLDQAIAYTGGTLSAAEIATMLGTVGADRVTALLRALAHGAGAEVIGVAREVSEFSPDYSQVFSEILSMLRRVAVYQVLGDESAALGETATVIELAGLMSPEDCQLYYQIGLLARRDLSLAPDLQIGFEMALLRMLAFRPQTSDATPVAPATPRPVRHTAGSPASTARQTLVPDASAVRKAAVPSAKALPSAPVAGSGAAFQAAAPNPSAAREAAVPNISAAPVAAPPSIPPLSLSPGTTLDWNQIVAALETTPLVRELARHCALRGFDGRVVDLVIAPQYGNLRSDRQLKGLEKAVRDQLQADIVVRLTVGEATDLLSPARQLSVAEAARLAAAERHLEQDATVQALKSEFGAVIEKITAK